MVGAFSAVRYPSSSVTLSPFCPSTIIQAASYKLRPFHRQGSVLYSIVHGRANRVLSSVMVSGDHPSAISSLLTVVRHIRRLETRRDTIRIIQKTYHLTYIPLSVIHPHATPFVMPCKQPPDSSSFYFCFIIVQSFNGKSSSSFIVRWGVRRHIPSHSLR